MEGTGGDGACSPRIDDAAVWDVRLVVEGASELSVGVYEIDSCPGCSYWLSAQVFNGSVQSISLEVVI